MSTRRRCAALLAAAILCTDQMSRWALASAGGGEGGPPERLADTGLYAAGRPGEIDPRNRRFVPQYPLWSDGAAKTRWVYLPDGGTIDAADPDAWIFPVGTRFWKEFAVGGRRIETRFLWKASSERWVAASYAWNADGTDAMLAPENGLARAAEIVPGRWHRIPSRADCAACHGAPQATPLGFNPLQLSTDRDPHAIHGEALADGAITLATLARERRLLPIPRTEAQLAPRIAAATPHTRTVLGYLAANCGGCHNGKGDISASRPSFALSDLLRDGDAVARALIDEPSRWQLPGRNDASVLIAPGDPGSSALLARMRTRQPSSQMPPLGTVVRDDDAVEAVAQWIAVDLAGPR